MPRFLRSLFLSFILSWLQFASALATETASKLPFAVPPELTTVFRDDFERDTRSEYVVQGDVVWTSGKLSLSSHASLERSLHSGPWARLSFQIDSLTVTPDQSLQELRVWLLLDDATDCCVSVQRHSGADGRAGRLVVFDTVEQDGEVSEIAVREMPLSAEHVGQCQWTIEYRYGLVRIAAGNQDLLMAHIDNHQARVRAIRILALDQPIALHLLEGARTVDTGILASNLTDEQQEELSALSDQQLSRVDQGEYSAAVEIARRELELCEAWLGKHHPACAVRLTNLGCLYREQSEFDRAVESYRRAIDLITSTLGPYHPSHVENLNMLMLAYLSKGDCTQAEAICEQIALYEKSLQGEHHPQYALTLSIWANMAEERGDGDAAESLYRESYACLKIACGEKHPECATVLSNLAVLYRNKGDFTRAEPLLVEAMEIVRATLGEQHPDFAYKLNNLGDLYTAMGKYTHAVSLYEQALPIVRASDGEESAEYATLLTNLAIVRSYLDDNTQAELLYRRAVDIRNSVLGKRHPDYASSLSNLACHYYEQGNLVQAQPLFEEAMKIRQEVLGERHPDYVDSLFALGQLHNAKGEYPQARILYERVLEMRKSLLGPRHPSVLAAMHTLAVLYREIGDHSQAAALFRQTLELKKVVLGEQHPEYAASLSQIAILYEQMEDFAQAEQFYLQAVEINKTIFGEQHPAYAKSINNLAKLLANLGRFARAERLHQQAISILEAAPDSSQSDYPTFLNNLAYLYYMTGDCAAAESLYSRSLEITKTALGDRHPGYALQLNNLASLYARMGDYRRAEQLSRQAVAIIEAALGKQHPSYATAINNRALHLKEMGDYARAEPLLRQAMEIRRSALGETHSDYAASISNLAGLYHVKGDHAQAATLHRQALEIYRNSVGEKHLKYAMGLSNLALLHCEMGDYARAEPWYREAMEIRGKILGNNHPDYASSLENLGTLYQQLRDFTRAVQCCERAVEIRKAAQGEDHIDYARSVNNLAAVYDEMGQNDRAQLLYATSLAIYERVLGSDHPSTATCLGNLGRLYAEMGNDSQARSLLQTSLEIRQRVLGQHHPSYAISVNNLAEWYRLIGDNRQAERLARDAATIVRQHLNLTSIVQSERQQKAMQDANRYVLDNYLSDAVALPADGQTVAEIVWQWKGVSSLRQHAFRQLAARAELAPLFADLQSVSYQLSALLERAPTPPQRSDSASLQASFETKRRLWEERFAELVHEREGLEQQIASQSELFRQVQQPLTVATVQQLLTQDTALVDFLEYNRAIADSTKTTRSWSQREYLALVITKHRAPIIIALGNARTMDGWVNDFRRPLSGDATPDVLPQAATAAVRLRTQLWDPIEQHLDGIKRIVILPDTALSTLPFSALPGARKDSYLLEDYAIATLPMVNLLQHLYPRDSDASPQRGLLVLGDIDYNTPSDSSPTDTTETQPLALNEEPDQPFRHGPDVTQQWSSLPGFRPELIAVTSLYQQRSGDSMKLTSLTGKDATETAFLQAAPQFGTLHVVTHGYFEPARKSLEGHAPQASTDPADSAGPEPMVDSWMPGLLSGLVMSGANHAVVGTSSHDGILRAAEIEATSLPGVDLVVLSACETGLGATAGGEGLTGLQRAFHIAGARTVVASLWKVDDRATLELITRFYTNLWQRNLSRLDALREAQLWMLQHPQELESLGIRHPRARGRVAELPKNSKIAPIRTATDRTDPYYWAGFQLSGDWMSGSVE